MQRVQIGSPQFEQVSLVSTLGWFTQVGARFVWSVLICLAYEKRGGSVPPGGPGIVLWDNPLQSTAPDLTGIQGGTRTQMATSRTTAPVLILGSGPAGLTAALYAARANLHPIVLEGAEAGGQLMLTTEVENYPGFPAGILGPELMGKMREQAERFGAEFVTADVTKAELAGPPFRAWVEDKEYTGKAVIIATGAKAKMLGLPGERQYLGRGVSTCATCDGFFYRNRELVVVGGGDSALEEATFLTRFATKVTIVHRRDRLRASKVMQDRAFANPKIGFEWNSTVVDVLGEQTVTGVRLRNVEDGSEKVLPVAGVFVAIGHTPNTGLFGGQVELDQAGYIVTPDPPSTATGVDGVFAAGDVVDHTYRQAVTAAGTGCAAAIDAERWLEAHGHDSGASTDNWD
jgi:thioredoxin reductase (NADPH)